MRSKAIVLMLGTVGVLPVMAATDPQAVDLGPVKFVPTLGVTQIYDDNIFRQPDDEVNSWITRVKPQMQFLAQQDANVIALTYMGDYGSYSNGSEDNYDDHTISVDGSLEANDKNRFKLAGNFAKLHDNRGTGGSEGIIANSRAEPDEYDATGYSLDYHFGSEGAFLGVELSAGETNMEYQNNRTETQFRDRENSSFGMKVSGLLAPKTKAFMQISRRDISYETTPQLRDVQGQIISVVPGVPLFGASLNSEELNILVGAEWEATGRTKGMIKVGRMNKDFESIDRNDSSFINWEASVLWAPRTYSYMMFTASKAPQETNGTGNFIKMSSYSVNWTHDWSDYVHTSVDVGLGNDTFENDPRQDDRESFAVSLNYDFDTWVNIGMGYSYDRRDSNTNRFDFARSQLMFSLNMSL